MRQFSVGQCMDSITKTSTDPFVASAVSPVRNRKLVGTNTTTVIVVDHVERNATDN